ncbi:hypothetical protein ACUOFC_22270, partial [Escherichia sp. TWPC-MK]
EQAAFSAMRCCAGLIFCASVPPLYLFSAAPVPGPLVFGPFRSGAVPLIAPLTFMTLSLSGAASLFGNAP